MASRPEQSERRSQILALKAKDKNLTARQIAERTGYSWGYVRNVLSAGRKRYLERVAACA